MKNENSLTKNEKAVLIGIITQHTTSFQANEYIAELEFLALTAGITTQKKYLQKVDHPDSAMFIGKGKLEEIHAFIQANKTTVAIFDDELSGTQIRNLEKILQCQILDRTGLILNIFAQRALTSYAKVQVELAQYQYMLPRLKRLWTHLERQKGGVNLRGPGETELETDKRVIRQRVTRLKEQLEQIDKQMFTQRKKRGEWVRVSLVGYTNVGKSTLMNLLSKSDVLAENKLFATLDTTVRKIVLENLPFLLSDTVGFIRKLPHSLVESFKSTLDEVRESDLLLHVVDISHPSFDEQITIVNQLLKEIKADEIPVIYIFNKSDCVQFLVESQTEDDFSDDAKNKISKSWIKSTYPQSIFISAKQRENIDELRKMMYDTVKDIHVTRYPYDKLLY